ncbi:MAG: hypothetical protein EAX95_02550 [Candidatus Thorarchaeota archaeon]|nr:hypothetical protein [Candidatus Thorarchaeota archaeon]
MEPIEEPAPKKKISSEPARASTNRETPAPKPARSQEPPSPTTGDKWVRPSEVAKDRIRTSPPKVKSELEKAREAFARAEEVGIEEGPEGIVETRMLRASEVRELMDSAAEMSREAERMAPPDIQGTSDSVPIPAAPRAPTPDDIEQGILGSRSTVVDRPAAEPARPQIPETMPKPGIPPRRIEEANAQPPRRPVTIAPQSTQEPVLQERSLEVEKAPTATPPSPKLVPEVDVLEMKIHDPDYLDDVSISGTLTDLRHLYTELKQVNSDLEEIRGRLDAEVLNHRNAAQVKKLRYEGLESEAKLAKQEWNDAEKEHRIADDRRKKEISSREKRIGEIEKRIKKGQEAIEKRVKELDKDKAKIAI